MPLFQQHLTHDQAVELVILDHQNRQRPRLDEHCRRPCRHLRQRCPQNLQRQSHPKRAAFAFLTVHRQHPAHPGNNPFDNPQTQPGPRRPPRIGGVQRHKIIKDAAKVGLGNANSGVRNDNLGRAAVGQMLHFNPDMAIPGEFDGVPDQIEQNLPQLRAVAFYQTAAIHGPDKPHVIAVGQIGRTLVFHDLLHQCRQINRASGIGGLATVQPGNVQNVVDMVHQQLARRLHDPQIFALMRLQVGRLQQFDRADHAIQRRADLVAHHHQKVGLGLFAGQSLVPRHGQGLFSGQLRRQIAQKGHIQRPVAFAGARN